MPVSFTTIDPAAGSNRLIMLTMFFGMMLEHSFTTLFCTLSGNGSNTKPRFRECGNT
jgi:hypothetical protein